MRLLYYPTRTLDEARELEPGIGVSSLCQFTAMLTIRAILVSISHPFDEIRN